jgi:hypothetical protein
LAKSKDTIFIENLRMRFIVLRKVFIFLIDKKIELLVIGSRVKQQDYGVGVVTNESIKY